MTVARITNDFLVLAAGGLAEIKGDGGRITLELPRNAVHWRIARFGGDRSARLRQCGGEVGIGGLCGDGRDQIARLLTQRFLLTKELHTREPDARCGSEKKEDGGREADPAMPLAEELLHEKR